MGAAFDDEPNYLLRGVILVAFGAALFFGLTWLQNAGIDAIDSSGIAQLLFRIQAPNFAGALFVLLGFVSWIRVLIGLVAYLNSCLLMTVLGCMVLIVITGVVLFVEYRPDLAAERVAERKAAEKAANNPDYLPKMRIFTAADGRTMEAEFLSFDRKKVKIRRSDGIEFSNSIELYSAADWDFIKEQQGKLW